MYHYAYDCSSGLGIIIDTQQLNLSSKTPVEIRSTTCRMGKISKPAMLLDEYGKLMFSNKALKK
jgi:hypothetical protein